MIMNLNMKVSGSLCQYSCHCFEIQTIFLARISHFLSIKVAERGFDRGQICVQLHFSAELGSLQPMPGLIKQLAQPISN